jgi:hypothetical protein
MPPASASSVLPHDSASGPDWLAEINHYREATGLADVSDQPAWDLGLEHHLTYLEDTPLSYETGQYASLHTENPASPYYTPDGGAEAGYSDLLEGGAFSPLQAVDIWLQAPFHAIGMLRAQLTQVALADDASTGHAGLDVIQGIDYSQPAATTPILFPGPGIATNLLTFGGEAPDPRETCQWQGENVGLPLIMLLPQAPAAGLTATLTGPTGTESTADGGLCVVDENTYTSSDPVYGPDGAAILRGNNAVILIPRLPLEGGVYTANVQQPGVSAIGWLFTAYVPVPVNQDPPTIFGSRVQGETLTASPGFWSNNPSSYDYQWSECDSSGNACSTISGATGTAHSLTPADLGHAIRVLVTASNSGGVGVQASSEATSPVRANPTRAQIAAALSTATKPSGKDARIGAIVKAHGYPFAIIAPTGGTIVIDWYARVARRRTLIASVRVVLRSAGLTTAKIKLTRSGTKQFAPSRRLRITGRARFIPPSGPIQTELIPSGVPVTSVTVAFTLTR